MENMSFNFGTSGQTPAPGTSATGLGMVTQSSASRGLQFGPTPTTASGGIQFGTGTSVGTSGVFRLPGVSNQSSTPSLFGGFQTTAPAAPAFGAAVTKSTSASTLSFGATPTAGVTSGGFTMTPPTSAAPSTGFPFGATTTSASTTFNFGKTTAVVAPTVTSPPAPIFSFTTPATSSATTSQPTTGFSFGTGTTKATTSASVGLSYGMPAATTVTAATGMSFGMPAVTAAGLSFGAPATTTAAAATGMNFGTMTVTTTGTGMSFKAPPSMSAATPGFSVTASKATSVGFGLGTSTVSCGGGTIASTTPTLTLGKPAATVSGFGFPGSSVPASSTIGFSLPASSGAAVGLTTATSTSASVAAGGPSMSFRQLEESINKWSLELEEQEKLFLNQATQVNAWDRLLVNNGEKITKLNDVVERVRLDQQRLDNELNFICSQQRELEELVSPLEAAACRAPSLSVQQHADLEREHTYGLAENVDAQLRRIAEDMRAMVEAVNAASSSRGDSGDPVVQVGRILSAHMDSLQWIDHNSQLLQRRLDDTSRTMESTRREIGRGD